MLDALKRLFGATPATPAATEATLPPDARLPFPHLLVPGKAALETWRQLQGEGRGYPLLMGDRGEVHQLVENREQSADTPAAILAAAATLDLDEWQRDRVAGDPEYYRLPPADEGIGKIVPAAATTLGAHLNVLTRRPKKEVVIGLLPVTESWEVPAWLKIGGWNECPPPEVHVALFREWQKHYGAHVASVTGDVIEFTVERPPLTDAEAMALARQQYVYCPDIVDQGVETVANLAASLKGAKVWFFWWD